MREQAGELAVRIAAEHPDLLTTEWRKEKRQGKIFVDVARNTYGQTVVAAYAVRALAGAPVSAPVTWDEVADPALTPHAYTLRTLPARLRDRRPVGGHPRARGNTPERSDRVDLPKPYAIWVKPHARSVDQGNAPSSTGATYECPSPSAPSSLPALAPSSLVLVVAIVVGVRATGSRQRERPEHRRL